MASVFEDGLRDIFASPLGRDARYTPVGSSSGPTKTVRILFAEPTISNDFDGVNSVSSAFSIEVRTAEISAPAEGDVFKLSDDNRSFTVNGYPLRSDDGAVWVLWVSQAGS